jgi:small subunit ribosomal protein S16
MLTIRFQRTGKRNRAEFRVVVAPKTAAAQKKFTEILGNYNPRTKVLVIKDQERLNYWLSQKLEMSPSVHNLFVTQKIVDAPKRSAFAIPKKEAPKEEAPAKPAQASEAGAEADSVVADQAEPAPAEPAVEAAPEEASAA